MKINWDISSETVLYCLSEARDTFYSLVDDLGVEIHEKDDEVLQSYWNDSDAYKHIKWVDVSSIRVNEAHPSCFTDSIIDKESITLTGCLIIINEEHLLDGNHRFNTIKRISEDKCVDFQVPVLYINKDY